MERLPHLAPDPPGWPEDFAVSKFYLKCQGLLGPIAGPNPIPLSILLCDWLAFCHRNWESYPKRMTDLLMKGNDRPGEGLHGEILAVLVTAVCPVQIEQFQTLDIKWCCLEG